MDIDIVTALHSGNLLRLKRDNMRAGVPSPPNAQGTLIFIANNKNWPLEYPLLAQFFYWKKKRLVHLVLR